MASCFREPVRAIIPACRSPILSICAPTSPIRCRPGAIKIKELVQAVPRRGDAGGRDHRQRQSVRRARIRDCLHRCRHSADHRRRDRARARARAAAASARSTATPPEPDRIVLLVQNEAGYRNLMQLVSRAYLDGEAGAEPALTLADLAAANEGLICLAGGAGGPIGRLLAEGQAEAAEAVLLALKAAFPGRLYIELMRHGLPEEARSEAGLIDLAYAHDLPLVATNNAYFPDRDFYEAHDALMCIAQGRAVADDDRRRLTPHHYFRPAAEMRALFADLPEACDNTLVIARRCAFIPQSRQPILPAFASGGRRRRGDARCAPPRAPGSRPGSPRLARRRGRCRGPYRERLEFELETIIQMGFAGYFLIVADFIQWAKRQGIPVGPGTRLGRRLGRRLGLDDHRSRPAALRPPVRAVPQPRAGLDARFRHRFLPGPARRGDPLRPAEIRPRPGRADHHLRQVAGPRRAARCRPGARHALRPGRPAVQAGAEQPGAPGHASNRRSPASRSAAAARLRRDRRPADDDRAEARRPLPARLDPRRRRRYRRPAALRAGAALPRPALRHAGDPVQHEMGRAGRARQIRLSRPQDADRSGALPRTARQRAASNSTSPACRSTTRRPSTCCRAATRSACSSSKAPACATC